MTWELEYLPEAQADLAALDNSVRQPVIKGIRVVYKLEHQNGIMKIIVVSARAENKVYDEAGRRRAKHVL